MSSAMSSALVCSTPMCPTADQNSLAHPAATDTAPCSACIALPAASSRWGRIDVTGVVVEHPAVPVAGDLSRQNVGEVLEGVQGGDDLAGQGVEVGVVRIAQRCNRTASSHPAIPASARATASAPADVSSTRPLLRAGWACVGWTGDAGSWTSCSWVRLVFIYLGFLPVLVCLPGRGCAVKIRRGARLPPSSPPPTRPSRWGAWWWRPSGRRCAR